MFFIGTTPRRAAKMKIAFRPPLIYVALLVLAGASPSADLLAQTSGTLTTQAAQNWTTAPWVITSGSGTFPDGGGVATWGTHTNVALGTVAVSATITLDAPITLSGIVYNSPFSMTLAGTNALTLPATGAIFDTPLTIANTLTLFQLANNTSAPITGGGAAGLTKTGAFNMTLSGNNTYTGGTHINGGMLAISSATLGDAILGATGAGNGISMNGGALLSNITAAGNLVTNRDIFIDTNGGAILPVAAMTINGNLTGGGDLTFPAFTAAVTFTGNNNFTGAIRKIATGTITLSGNAALNQVSLYEYSGPLTLSNTTTNVNDRLSDTAPITAHQMTINLTGNAGAATTEQGGVLTLAHGINTLTVTPDVNQPASLAFPSIIRQNRSTLQVRGTNLGGTAGANVGQIISAASPGTLVGGGGAAGSTSISILPWAVGNTVAGVTTSSSFVTYNSTGGTFRPLATTEYAALVSGAVGTDNTSVAVATTIAAPTTVNSVLVTGTGTLLSGTGGLNITSGALMYSPVNTTAGTISADINFGSAEGVITSSAGAANSFTPGVIVSGALSGTGGLTVNPINGSSIQLSGASTYTGTTTLLGFTLFSGTITNDGTPSPLGAGTSPIFNTSSPPGWFTTMALMTTSKHQFASQRINAKTQRREDAARVDVPGPARASSSWTHARHKVEQSACKPIVESAAAAPGREDPPTPGSGRRNLRPANNCSYAALRLL
jgi:autotransporter-associated beta strand protein